MIIDWAKETLRLGSISFVLAVLAIGVVLLMVRPRWGRRWMIAVVLGYWFVSTPFGSSLFIRPLVRGFHSIEDPRQAGKVDAIVVLGGGIRDIRARSETLAYPYESTTLRVLEGARLFRLFGGEPLVVASGGFSARGNRVSEATVIVDALRRLGIPDDHILIEEKSRTTRDQAFYVTRALQARGIHRYVLVTSPTHMARSVAVFRAQGGEPVPSIAALLPESTRKRRFFVPNEDSLEISDAAVYDYAGSVYYWARGWFEPVSPAVAR